MRNTLPPADPRSVFAHSPVGVALTTPDGILLNANPALCRLLGMTAELLHGRSVLDLVHPDGAAATREAHATLMADHSRPMRHETRLVHADGPEIPVQVTAAWVDATPEGGPAHLVMIVEDITDRKELEAQLLHRALHDSLTGLPNRFLFRDRLRHALDRGHREHTPTCVLLIDLDHFKAVNDRFGHPVGDQVLVGFAQRLRSVLRASDTAARQGGDEFSIVCENTDRSHAEILADRLRAAIREPLVLGDAVIPLGISIGIGSVPAGGDPEWLTDPEQVCERVIREADAALYATKHRRS
jgi:diguanylate cyclase (GGDEF)-like protein/PAS domain S-box-containing protein